MTIDAMDLLYQGKVDGFGIMSSDSDFTPLAMRLKQDGLLVYGFGRASTPEAFQNACTRFLEVDRLIAAEDEEPAATIAPGKRKTRQIDPEIIDLLGAAWKEARRDSGGFARLSDVGKIFNNRSSVDARNFGFTRLVDLVEAAGDQFRVERREDGVYVKRVR